MINKPPAPPEDEPRDITIYELVFGLLVIFLSLMAVALAASGYWNVLLG